MTQYEKKIGEVCEYIKSMGIEIPETFCGELTEKINAKLVRRCAGKSKSGLPCGITGNQFVLANGYCYNHQEKETKEQMKQKKATEVEIKKKAFHPCEHKIHTRENPSCMSRIGIQPIMFQEEEHYFCATHRLRPEKLCIQ